MQAVAPGASRAWAPGGAPDVADDPALTAYEGLAPFYDAFTEGYTYDPWVAQIEAWALAHGLRGTRLLDVACGTGKSFEPLLSRGYQLAACDLSPAMVARAQRRAPAASDLRVADMRALPWRSAFDLATCLDDALNYMLSRADLDRALQSIHAVLAPGGILVFDTNSLRTYRTTFAEDFEIRRDGYTFLWRGQVGCHAQPGVLATATVEVRNRSRRVVSTHIQRHWAVSTLRAACSRAGFDRVSFRGQLPGGRLVGDPDEDRHTKIVCLAARAPEPCAPHASPGLAAPASSRRGVEQ